LPYYDTHAHLDDEQLIEQLDQVLDRARQADVQHVLAMGTTAESSQSCVTIASQFDMVYAAVGIQPNYVAQAAANDWHTIVSLSEHPRVRAIGETGLDRYWDYAPWDQQWDYFMRHMELAHVQRLPFVVHLRDCETEMLDALREAHRRFGQLRGVMHSFTGSAETAAACVDLGLHISFAGMLTYKKSDALRAVAMTVPGDRLLIETDAPYLSPHPKRGQRPNEPALVIHTAACLAEIRGLTPDEIGQLTTQNALELFRRT
jgi:TatD DNase family protein